MADTQKFVHWLERELRSNAEAFVKNAELEFAAESSLEGWAAIPLMKILNYAVSECLQDGEIYLEIGTYAGRSLIPALKNNNARAYVIDNFWDSATLKPMFQRNVERFGVQDRIDLYDGNAEDFNQPLPGKIGVYLYDANHDRGFSHFNLEKFKPYLSEQAIIIVDDVRIPAGVGHKCKDGYQMKSNMPVLDDVDQWCMENSGVTWPICITPWTYGQIIIAYNKRGFSLDAVPMA